MSAQRRGEPASDAWGAAALAAALDPLLPGVAVEVADRVSSTNTVLVERARAGDAPPCLLVAIEQTAGRGRLGRGWRSAAGASLTFSLSLAYAPRDWAGLSLAVGVAIAEALHPGAPPAAPRIALKWPNDLWLAGEGARKLGGILIETVGAGAGSVRRAVIGVGLNVDAAPAIEGEAAGEVAALSEIDAALDAPVALHRLAVPLARALALFEREGFAAFAERYAARDALRGRGVRTTHALAPIGVVRGVAADGALVVATPRGVVRVATGDVSVRLS